MKKYTYSIRLDYYKNGSPSYSDHDESSYDEADYNAWKNAGDGNAAMGYIKTTLEAQGLDWWAYDIKDGDDTRVTVERYDEDEDKWMDDDREWASTALERYGVYRRGTMTMRNQHMKDALMLEAIARLSDDDLLDLYITYWDEPEVTGHSFLEAEVGLRFNKEYDEDEDLPPLFGEEADSEDEDDEDGAVYYECSCEDGKPVWTVVGGETDTVRSADKEA